MFYFKELPAKNQKAMQDGWMAVLPNILAGCRGRINAYANSDESSGGVTKMLTEIDMGIEMLIEARCELVKRHKLKWMPPA